MNVDATWRCENKKFTIGNSLPLSDLNAIEWEHSICLQTGKVKTETSMTLKDLSREDFKRYQLNLDKTIKHKQRDFYSRFFYDLDDAKESLFLKKNKLGTKGIPAKKFDEFVIFPLKENFISKNFVGLLFLNDKTGQTFKIKSDTNGELYLPKISNNENIYFANTILEGMNCYILTGANVCTTVSIDDLITEANKYASLNHEETIVVLGKNPSKKDLQSDTSPMEYLKKFRDNFSKTLNIFVKLPPFYSISDSDDKKSPETFFDFYYINPIQCEKIMNDIRDFPNIKILGALGDRLIVWSKHLKSPLELRETSKEPTLLLLAQEEYFKEKFGTNNPKIIVKKLFDIGRGKHFENHKIRQAGIWNEGKNIIINTGKHIIGDPNKKNGYVYLKVRKFPHPAKEHIKSQDFLDLYSKVISTISFKEQEEGLVIFAWSILSLFAHIIPARFTLHLYGDSNGGKSFTRDEIMLPLQNAFKDSVKKYAPGCTFAGFKEDLRQGHSVFHFEEAQGKNYDEDIIKLIRASTYGNTEIKQMKGASGGTVITPVSFMSSSAFNFEPAGLQLADRNRIYEINYSANRLNQESIKETFSWLAKLDLEALGKQCFDYLYYRWDDFLREYEVSKNDPNFFGIILNGHKRSVYAQIIAFYRITGLISNDTLSKFVKFLANKEHTESYTDFNSSFVDSISRILLFDQDGFKKKTIKYLIDGVELMKDKNETSEFNRHREWLYWVKHAYNTYQIKIIKPSSRKGLWLAIPPKDNFIISNLKRAGFSESESNSYNAVLESEFGFRANVKFGNKGRRSICIPLESIASSEALVKWKEAKEYLQRIYKDES